MFLSIDILVWSETFCTNPHIQYVFMKNLSVRQFRIIVEHFCEQMGSGNPMENIPNYFGGRFGHLNSQLHIFYFEDLYRSEI